jgi:uncharacterized repeat protein (TIGR04138 family)
MREKLEKVARDDGRYSPRAVRYVYEGLSYTAKKLVSKPGHVTGQTLCEGLRKRAVEKWGRLALVVLNTWGVRTTRDFGEIVWLLIEHKWMSAQPADTIDDFNDVYDFKTVLKDQFEF